jgi:glycerol uptake facilitator-like aquaporin
MFAKPVLMVSQHARAGWSQGLSEVVATFGLLSAILGTGHRRPDAVPFAVGAYIVAAYWFTASTSFANPAVTIGRPGRRPACVRARSRMRRDAR